MDEEEKSKRCLSCGECCKWFILEVRKPDLPSEVKAYEEWFNARGIIIVRIYQNRWRLKFPWPCPHLKHTFDRLGLDDDYMDKWTCNIYLARPAICRKFDGRLEDKRDGLRCLWGEEKQED